MAVECVLTLHGCESLKHAKPPLAVPDFQQGRERRSLALGRYPLHPALSLSLPACCESTAKTKPEESPAKTIKAGYSEGKNGLSQRLQNILLKVHQRS